MSKEIVKALQDQIIILNGEKKKIDKQIVALQNCINAIATDEPGTVRHLVPIRNTRGPGKAKNLLNQAGVTAEAVPLRHTDANLEKFKSILEKSLHSHKDEMTFVKKAHEHGSNTATPEEAKKKFDDLTTLIAEHEQALARIENKSYGIDSHGKLVGIEVLIKNLLLNE